MDELSYTHTLTQVGVGDQSRDFTSLRRVLFHTTEASLFKGGRGGLLALCGGGPSANIRLARHCRRGSTSVRALVLKLPLTAHFTFR